MTPTDLEEFVARFYEEKHEYVTQLTQGSWDGGVDIYVSDEIDPNGRLPLFAIQVKRYDPSRPISGSTIERYIEVENTLTIVSTGRFTQPARRIANHARINLINGEDLCWLIEKHNAYALVEEYLDQ
ncbi:restriction endonuclease [Natronorubrum sp. FCH18a]|uniref:restriction endonuclease n=1 Tax=Natronorubrum sp. FCH18a TaxID=3447018 RepID=UPI003F5131A6